MVDQRLDPSVQKFKEFINKYPGLCEEIHLNKVNIQTLYEKWVVLGEDDSYWLTYEQTNYDKDSRSESESESNTSDVVQTIMNATKNMDMNKVQTYVEQLSSAVQSFQEMIEQFTEHKSSSASLKENQRDQANKNHFFQWMRD